MHEIMASISEFGLAQVLNDSLLIEGEGGEEMIITDWGKGIDSCFIKQHGKEGTNL